jgi:phage tail-like protein
MASTGTRYDPFLAFRFEVRINGFKSAGFSECTGLQMETDVESYPEGGLNTHLRKFPTRTKQSNIILKRGIASSELWGWYYDLTQGKVKRCDGSILVYDPAGGNVTMEWQFSEAFPTKWTGPDLNATQNNVAVETLELCHQGLRRSR